MKVAFQLRRRSEPAVAAALLVPGRDAAAPLRLCARHGVDPEGRLFLVAGGFLLMLEGAGAQWPAPGSIRLRRLAEGLYLPVDAELVPALLDDEAEGLARDRGLVLLPGGRVLAYDRHAPVPASAWLSASPSPRRDWRPLPQPSMPAARLEEVAVELPGDGPDDLLEAGGGEIGTEDPRPDEGSLPAKLAAEAALGAGRGMVWLGRTFGLGGLARLGAGWINRAVDRVPRAGESVLGRQGAALRDLLREFQEGDVERALRRALPLGDPGESRGAVPHPGDQLPTHRLLYNLGDLLGAAGRGQGPPGVWLGGRDVMAELAREYRKAAEQAVARGDHRRAAFIYGKLLKDFRAAAHALIAGGLHRDAALLLLARLNDRRGAALAFEAAGEFDRAIQLYRELAEREAAGDLLRRIGEEEEALAEYRAEAARRIAAGGGWLSAGDLLLNKAGRPDLALVHYAAGWGDRPATDALPCALRLAGLFADAGDLDGLRTLVAEADRFFASPGLPADAARFYNELARLADRKPLEAARDELRDRALLGLAARLRDAAKPGVRPVGLVSTLLGRTGVWPVGLASDAESAVAAACRPPQEAPAAGHRPRLRRFRVGEGSVSAVATAGESDEVFLGFEEGDVYAFCPERSEVVRIASYPLPVTALGVSADGAYVIALRGADGGGTGAVSTHRKEANGFYRTLVGSPLEDLGEGRLTPVVRGASGPRVGLWDGRELHILAATTLASQGRIGLLDGEGGDAPAAILPLPAGAGESGFLAFAHHVKGWSLYDAERGLRQRTELVWRPRLAESSPLRSPPVQLAWSVPDGFEMAGLGGYGTLFWASLRIRDGVIVVEGSNVVSDVPGDGGGYLAAAIVRPGLVAGVTGTRVDWIRLGGDRFTKLGSVDVAVPGVVACHASRKAGDLVVVSADGFVARVPLPR